MMYDVVIIGAGIGGLASAVRLVLAGYKPIVLEKMSFLGGRFSAADYKGYRLTTAAWYINGPNGAVWKLAKDSGVADRLEVLPTPDPPWRFWFEGKMWEAPKKGGLRSNLSMLVAPHELERLYTPLSKALKWQEPSDNISFKEWLSQYTDDWKVFRYFDLTIQDVTGVQTDSCPAGEMIRILKYWGSIGGGNWILPKGHLRPLIDGFEEVIKSKGGEIATKARVKEIVVENHSAKGVVVEGEGKEREIESQVVISDCSPQDMIKLAGEANFDKGYLERVHSMKPTNLVNIYWGCSKQVLPDPSVVCFLDDPPFIAVDYTMLWPDMAPDGKHTLLGMWTLPFNKPYNLRNEIEQMQKQVYNHFPVLEENGELLVVQVFRKTWPAILAAPGYDIGNKSPIENLYVVGDGAKPRGTVVADGTVEGANLVVEDIKRRIKPIG
jgi:phytoene dehydrogenase-like protein